MKEGKELPSTKGHKESLRNKAECAERGIKEDILKLYERERERERVQNYLELPNNLC